MIPIFILLGTFVLALFNPKRATLAAALLSAFWFEWDLPFGGRLGVFDMLFFGGICGLLANRGGGQASMRTPCAKLVLAYIVISFISYFSNHLAVDFSKLLWGELKTVFFTASYFLFYRTIDDEAFLMKVIRCFLISATVSGLIGVAQHFSHSPLEFLFTGTYLDDLKTGWITFDGATRASSSLEHPVIFGTFMVLPVVLLECMIWTDPTMWRRKSSWFMLGATSLGMLFSFTRAAWVGAFFASVAAVMLLKMYREPRFWKLMAAGVALIALLVASGKVPAKYFDRLKTLEDAKNDNAMTPRYERWAYFYERSTKAPWLGWGIVTDEQARESLEDAVSPHNSFLFLAVQRGWIATSIMTVILLLLWKEGWAGVKAAPDESSRGLAVGLFVGAVGLFGIGGNFASLWEDTQCSVVFWLLLALVARFRHLVRRTESDGELSSDAEPQEEGPEVLSNAS